MLLLEDALDGEGRDKQCACIEKQLSWFVHALATWRAQWYGKTEDDTYVNLPALQFDLLRPELHRSISPHVVYGLMNVCSQRPLQAVVTAAARNLSLGYKLLGHGSCFLGDLERGVGAGVSNPRGRRNERRELYASRTTPITQPRTLT